MMRLLAAFSLGNSAILTNVCLLPLYPGLLAFLAGNTHQYDEETQHKPVWLSILVLLGVLCTMLVFGLVLHLFRQSFATILPYLLPIIYGLVVLMGFSMLANRNPFVRFSTVQVPVVNNPYITAFLYGVFLAPMTLPCTGPLVISTFILGAGSTTSLINEILYFLFFGLGFGWPLVALPLVATSMQKGFLNWMTQNHALLNRLAGVLLIAVGLWSFWVEALPLL